MKTYKVTVIEPGTSTFDPDLCFTKTVQATDRKDAQRKALIDERGWCYVSEVIDTTARLIPDYGAVFTMEKFIDLARSGAVTKHDGTGRYSDGKQMFHEIDLTNAHNIDPTLWCPDKTYSHVVWFNK